MIRIILLGILLTTLVKDSYSADNYTVGENLFVWAPSGLPLRSEPNTTSAIITTLEFGQKVLIMEKTDLKCNVNFNPALRLDTSSNKVDSIILYGHWVKVAVDSIIVGYVIDQYLLKFQPSKNHNEWVLKLIKADTISMLQFLPDGSHTDLVIQKTYNHDIIGIETTGENWGGTVYTFPGFTIEEVLVFFFHSKQESSKYAIASNKKDEIIFTDHSCMQITIQHIGSATTVEILGGC